MNAQVETPVPPTPLFKDASERAHTKIIAAGVAMHGILAHQGPNATDSSTVIYKSFDLAELFIQRAEEIYDAATRIVEPSAEVAP